MKIEDLIVRCAIKREGAVWVATCVDFSLAAQANTAHEAREKLHAQIRSYVRDALGRDSAYAYELLTRKGPIGDRLAWYAGFIAQQLGVFRLCARLSKMSRHSVRGKLSLYREPLPVVPV